jgi:hypothetical protein
MCFILTNTFLVKRKKEKEKQFWGWGVVDGVNGCGLAKSLKVNFTFKSLFIL